MTSVQERLQIKRTALDKWSIKERLCLASAVHCSGDQNWMSVSRSLKLLCSSHNRPPDWFSQKSCAVQYGELLENVETPKRKKRTNSDNPNQPAETPTESILRNLKQERIAELEALIQNERDLYLKLHKDALSLQNNSTSDQQIREMWLYIQKEKEEQILKEQKYNEWLKEREERKLELQRAWKPTFVSNISTGQNNTVQGSQGTNLKHEDMDIDETITPTIISTKPQQNATSPLLTSLLKTPSPTLGPTSVVHTNSTPSPRTQAPTITNLLTGGQLPPNPVPHQQYKIVHPLTGPPMHMTGATPVVQSPSQAAPTLSMLLENKTVNKEMVKSIEEKPQNTQQQIEEEGDGSDSPNKDELMEVFKGLIDENIDENIDELAEILTNNNDIPDILDEALENVDLEDHLSQDNTLLTEINEENAQEKSSKNVTGVFTNSDVKEEIKPVVESPPICSKVKNETPIDEKPVQLTSLASVKEDKEESENSVQFIETKDESQELLNDLTSNIKTEESNFKSSPVDNDKEDKKSEISEDSGDMTFQEIANEINEKIKAEEGQDSKESSEDVMEITENLQSIQSIESDDKKSIFTFEDSQEATASKNESFSKSQCLIVKDIPKKFANDSSDIIIIPEDDDSNEKNKTLSHTNSSNISEFDVGKTDIPEKNVDEKLDENKIVLKTDLDELKKIESTTITIIDTDDDSTHTDTTTKEEKLTEYLVPKVNSKCELTTVKAEGDENKDDEKLFNAKKINRGPEQEDSESMIIDEDLNDSLLPRARRRYSTPVIDSVPNSPASSVEINDQKAWKKSILAAYSKLMNHKHSSFFLRIPSDEQAPKFKQIILNPMDLTTIKRNIDTGSIKSTNEFQRDLLLMCINTIMYYEKNSENYVAAKEFIVEIKLVCYELIEKDTKKDNDDSHDTSISLANTSTNLISTTSNSSKIRSRKSQRF